MACFRANGDKMVTLTWRRAAVSRSSKTLNDTDVFFLGDPKLSILI